MVLQKQMDHGMAVLWNFKTYSQSLALLIIFITFVGYGQSDEKSNFFVNTSLVEIMVIKESGYSIMDKNLNNTGTSVELSSIYGHYFFKHFLISAGLGLNLTFNDFQKMIPLLIDFKWYLNDYGKNSLFLSYCFGTGLKIGSFSTGNSGKASIGIQIKSDYNSNYYLETFYKLRDFSINEKQDTYSIEGIGISLGINF